MKNKNAPTKPATPDNPKASAELRCSALLGVKEATFVFGRKEINMKVVDGCIRIYADGTLKVTPWASNSIRLSIDTEAVWVQPLPQSPNDQNSESETAPAVDLHRMGRLRRWNVEDRDDGLYYCDGLHVRSAPCDWQKMTSDAWLAQMSEREAQPADQDQARREQPAPAVASSDRFGWWEIPHPGTLEKIKCATFNEAMDKRFEGFNIPVLVVDGVREDFSKACDRVRRYYAAPNAGISDGAPPTP